MKLNQIYNSLILTNQIYLAIFNKKKYQKYHNNNKKKSNYISIKMKIKVFLKILILMEKKLYLDLKILIILQKNFWHIFLIAN